MTILRYSMPYYNICTRNKGRNIKARQMFKANEMNVQRQNNNRIRSQKSENPAI